MKFTSMKKTRWENWSNLLLGFWVFVTPWTLTSGFSAEGGNTQLWNFLFTGTLVSVVSILAINKVQIWAEWMNLLSGLWLMFSPWFLLYYDNRLLTVHSQICGFLFVLLSGLTITSNEKYRKISLLKRQSQRR